MVTQHRERETTIPLCRKGAAITWVLAGKPQLPAQQPHRLWIINRHLSRFLHLGKHFPGTRECSEFSSAPKERPDLSCCRNRPGSFESTCTCFPGGEGEPTMPHGCQGAAIAQVSAWKPCPPSSVAPRTVDCKGPHQIFVLGQTLPGTHECSQCSSAPKEGTCPRQLWE